MFSKYFNNGVLLSKKQVASIIFLIIIISGIFGWLYEVLFYYLNSGMKTFYMRGGNFLPWINIYVYGAFLILFLTCKRRNHPIQVFLISIIATGILEYLSGYVLYGKLGWVKCWDYNQEILNFGNINGYVCLRSVLVFGLSSLLLMYAIVPLLIKLVNSRYVNIIFLISSILCFILLFDEVYNLIFADLFNLPKATNIYKNLGFKYLYFK